MELYVADPYWPPIVILSFWFAVAILQIGLEILIWKGHSARHGLNRASLYLGQFLSLPLMIALAIYLIGHFESSNLQFITYNLLMMSYTLVVLFGILGITWMRKRKVNAIQGELDAANNFAGKVRFSFTLQILAAIMAVAAKFHIENDWVTNLFS